MRYLFLAGVLSQHMGFAQVKSDCPSGPLTEDALVILTSGGATEKRIIQMIEQCSLAFVPDASVNASLRSRGVASSVLASLPIPPAQKSASDESTRLRADLALWESAKERNTRQAYEDYLQKFPQGTFASAAQDHIGKLATPVPPPSASQTLQTSPSSEQPNGTYFREAYDAIYFTGAWVTARAHVGRLVLDPKGLRFFADPKEIFIRWSEIKAVKTCKKNYKEPWGTDPSQLNRTDFAAFCLDTLHGDYSFSSKSNTEIIAIIRRQSAL